MVEITDPGWVSLKRLIKGEEDAVGLKEELDKICQKKRKNLLENSIWGAGHRKGPYCAVCLGVIYTNKRNIISFYRNSF